MFVASHIVAGSLLYDALSDETNPRAKWTFAIAGSFVFHWVLDVTPAYHDMTWPYDSGQWFIALFNVVFIALFWWASRRSKRWWLPSDRVLWGVILWLIWDVFWIENLWNDNAAGGPHWLTTRWGHITKWPNQSSFILEGSFIVLVGLISLPYMSHWWKTSQRAESLKSTLTRMPMPSRR